MVIKFGRFGQFLACSNYPECRTTREIAKPQTAGAEGAGATATAQAGGDGAVAAAAEAEEETCELCGKPMALKRGRFGQFLGCTGYPECRNIRKISKSGQARPAPVPLDEKLSGKRRAARPRHGRFGEFVSCATIRRANTSSARRRNRVPRPGCRGESSSKIERGKLFYVVGVSEVRRGLLGQADTEKCPQCGAVRVGEDDEEGTTRIARKKSAAGAASQSRAARQAPPATGGTGGRRAAS